MSTGPPIPEIQHFQNLTLKIQGQCHNWRPHSRYNTLLNHIIFVWCQWALTVLSIAIEKFDLENPRSRSWLRWTLRVTPWVQHSIDSHPFRSKSISHPIPEIQLFFKFDLEKSMVKVMVEVQAESHKVGVTSYRFTSLSFHVNRPSHSWDKAFSKFDLENSKSRSNDHDVAQLQV